jgi:PAS domain S-box-containing protein
MSIPKLPISNTDNSTQTIQVADQSIILNSLPCGVVETDSVGVITYLNDSWIELTGYIKEHCIGTSLQRYVAPDDQSLLQEVFSSAGGPEEGVCKLRLLCSDSNVKWVQFNCHQTQTKGLGAGLLGILTDISQHVGREASLLANHRTLSELLNDFRGVVFRCRNDKQWTMEYISAGSLALTGYRPSEIINNARISYDKMIVEEDREEVRATVKRAILEKSGYDLIYSINTAEGERKLIWERAKGIYSQGNDLLGLEGYMTDISSYQDYLVDNTLAEPRSNEQSVSDVFFGDRVAHRMQRYQHNAQQDYAIVNIHLDNFQRYTSSLSVADSQRVNLEVLERFKRVLSPVDSISYRLIHDVEIILDDVESAQSLRLKLEELQAHFRNPISLDETDVFLTLSIGVALASEIESEPERSLSELRRYANRAMMHVHEVGGNDLVFYSASTYLNVGMP